ncbi:MAG: 16S rRNA (adenine(1518)-N(6)/adenine(1519)-N(6))-dimethyltransferase RsmA [Azoarcus sp.]|jgi:16S rRNA (adenine1518-N6/adenine1519-N6)-dimethyltransferase|nr:16S rRNA (adenine(1518)-N(6)/adenine(1519)-N(6))-dimethyltransferase RsmA [Azoarcus sp.]
MNPNAGMGGHIARRRFGQNFLVSPGIIDRIIAAIQPCQGDNMVEIGPGLGALTQPLAERLNHLHVVEIDRDLIARLRQRYDANKLTIFEVDALKFDFGALCGAGAPLRVVGNLPYNISTPLLFHLADFISCLRDLHFMLQKEVVMRMVAMPGTADYGRLSVMLQARFHVERLFDVPSGAFRPAPKVTSSIVRMAPLPAGASGVGNEKLFARIVAAAFSQRRKILRNTLKDFLGESGFTALGIDPGIRAEQLSVADFAAITHYCDEHFRPA